MTRRAREWWFNVSRVPCPVCGKPRTLDCEQRHGRGQAHPVNVWRAALGLPPEDGDWEAQ